MRNHFGAIAIAAITFLVSVGAALLLVGASLGA